MAITRSQALGYRRIASWTALGLGLALASLPGCARLGGSGGAAAPVQGPMAPVLAIGDSFTYDDTGTQVQEKVTGFSGQRAIWQNDRGVTWIQSADVISPPIAWSGDPRLGQGNQQVFGEPGRLFPLALGKTVKFQVAGTAEKVPDGWQAENSCSVAGKQPVTVKAGTFETWRIVCQRGEVTETINYVPELMTYALRIRERGKEPPYERKELTTFDLAQTPERAPPAAAAKAIEPAMAAPAPDAAPTAAVAATPAAPMAVAPATAAPMATPETDVARLAQRVEVLESLISRLDRQAGGQSASPAGGAPRPTTPARAAAPASAASAAPAAPTATPGGRYGAHLGSYRTVDEAKNGFATLAKANPEQLGSLGYQTAEFDPGDGRGVFIRLIGGPFDERGKAQSLCAALQPKRIFCRVVNLGSPA